MRAQVSPSTSLSPLQTRALGGIVQTSRRHEVLLQHTLQRADPRGHPGRAERAILQRPASRGKHNFPDVFRDSTMLQAGAFLHELCDLNGPLGNAAHARRRSGSTNMLARQSTGCSFPAKLGSATSLLLAKKRMPRLPGPAGLLGVLGVVCLFDLIGMRAWFVRFVWFV